GVLVQRNFELCSRVLHKHLFPALFVLYTGYALAMKSIGYQMDNSFSPLLFFPLAAVTFAGAFSAPSLAHTLLRRQDISYGVYIYHVPVMNMFLYYGYKDELKFTFLTVAIAIVVGIASWLLVEKPSLRRKRRASHPIEATPALKISTDPQPSAERVKP